MTTVILVAGMMLLLSGCFSQVGVSADQTPLNDGRIQVLPLSGLNHYTEGTSSLHFELPSDVTYRPVATRTQDAPGAAPGLVRTWRASTEGGSCIVIAGEQPGYRGAFPAAAIASFAAGREPGTQVEQNQAIDPVPGTVAGVSQRSTYPITPGPGVQGVLIVRQYLTDKSTLISLNVAGPASAVRSCRLAEIAGTLQPGAAP
jgi:hypothetical protein